MTINGQDYGVGELQITSLPFDRGSAKLNLCGSGNFNPTYLLLYVF